jgi:CDGSH-type Zn-finger protein
LPPTLRPEKEFSSTIRQSYMAFRDARRIKAVKREPPRLRRQTRLILSSSRDIHPDGGSRRVEQTCAGKLSALEEKRMPLSYEDLIEPTIVKQVSKSVAYCRCTRTKTPPFCDGSHTATNIKPYILELDEPQTIAICRCWRSKDHPYCDGTHGRLVKPKERPAKKHV